MNTASITRLMALALVAAPSAALAQTYRVVDLGSSTAQSRAFALRSDGLPAGNTTDASAHFIPASFDPGALLYPGLPGYSESAIFSFLPDGSAVGVAYTLGSFGSQAVRWTNGVPVALGAFQPHASNASGDIVGTTLVRINGYAFPTACILKNNTLTNLPALGGSTSQALGVDDSGRVVGSASTAQEASSRPTLWLNGVAKNLGTLGGVNGQAYAINGTRIVGWSQNAAGVRRPTLWNIDAAGTVLSRVDLGGATPSTPGLATGFVGASDIIGISSFHATLFRNNTAIDLNTRVQDAPNWSLEQVWASNASGQLAGNGSWLGTPRAFRLDPCVSDLNSDLVVDLEDFFAFFNCFDQSLPCADIDGVAGIDLNDFFLFLNGFDAGC